MTVRMAIAMGGIGMMLWGGICPALGATNTSFAALRARMHALSRNTARNGAGTIFVSGTNRLDNLALLGWCEDLSERVATLTRIPVAMERHFITVTVREDAVCVSGGAAVRHGRAGGRFVHRVYLRDYDTALTRFGRQAMCHAIVATYVNTSSEAMLKMPDWIWKGIEQNTFRRVRADNMERVLLRWGQGTLYSARQILAGAVESDVFAYDDADRRAIYGVFVRWLSSLPDRADCFRALFSKISARQAITPDGVAAYVPMVSAVIGLDDAWDHWLIAQRDVVHALGTVSTRHLNALRSELLISRGACGIPVDVALAPGARFAALVPLRRRAWIPGFVREKQRRLELLAAGRAPAFQRVMQCFREVLLAIEGSASDDVLYAQLAAAQAALDALATRVQTAGGVLHETATAEWDSRESN